MIVSNSPYHFNKILYRAILQAISATRKHSCHLFFRDEVLLKFNAYNCIWLLIWFSISLSITVQFQNIDRDEPSIVTWALKQLRSYFLQKNFSVELQSFISEYFSCCSFIDNHKCDTARHDFQIYFSNIDSTIIT